MTAPHMSDPTDDCLDEQSPRLTDGRSIGETVSKFSTRDKVQLAVEGVLLLAAIVGGLGYLVSILSCVSFLEFGDGTSSTAPSLNYCTKDQAPLIMSVAFFISGLIGGAVFSLKWLYHSVAKTIWHQDRLLWRISVPLMGGVLAVFVTYIFSRTFGTSFSPASLTTTNFLPACGLSFLVGIFADGTLASLEKLARNIFGTLESFSGAK